MTTWAYIANGAVVETTTISPAGRFNPAMLWVACPDNTSGGEIATEAAGVWTFAPPPVLTPPTLTLAQQAAAAIGAGLTITSPSIPLSAVPFDCSATQDHINAEVTSLLLNGTFADGSATVVWTDIASPPAQHTMTVAQFKAFATAEAAYVAALYKVMEGVLATLPPAAVTIA